MVDTRTGPNGGTSMSWTIERRGRVAVVTMTTNPVNAQNRAFFADLHEAIDRLERDHADSPVVLTGTSTRFSAGIDLGEHFALFARDPAAVGVLVPRLPGDEHATIYLPAPDRGGRKRARLCWRPHHRRRL
jgi:enoyl-CoA hydratase/carnithine racemase